LATFGCLPPRVQWRDEDYQDRNWQQTDHRAPPEFGSVPEKHQKENANYDSDDGESY
jgi:hypothetical protein